MQEEVEQKSVQLAVTSTKSGLRLLDKMVHTYLAHRKETKLQKKARKPQKKIQHPHKEGKQKVKTLVKQGEGVSSIPVGGTGIKDFNRIAKRYGVDFAIVKDKTEHPEKYTVFFKAKDADAITHVLKEYAKKELHKQNRQSVWEKLKRCKKKAKSEQPHHKEKRKEKCR